MSSDSDAMQATIRRNVVSNYVHAAYRMVRGIVVFRLLYEYLSAEEFGYWALLWSVFGYGVLLDFGFGVTVQKSVAQLAALEKWQELNRTLSTILVVYFGIGAVLMLAAFTGGSYWNDWVDISAANTARFEDIFKVFIGVMAVMFPLGVFPGMLRGQQRIALVNWITVGIGVLGFAGVALAVTLRWSFLTIVWISLGEQVLVSLICVVLSFIHMPGLRLSPRLFSRNLLGEVVRFSFIAYFIMISYIIMTKTDLVVIGMMLSASAVALYQPGAKLAETFSMLVRQMSGVLQPAAAHLYAKGDKEGVSKLLTGGMRFTSLVATPLYVVTAFYLPQLLKWLTGTSDETTIAVGHVLVLWSYGFVLTHNIYKGIALMGGHERKLLTIGLIEAGANVGLSILLVALGHGVLGVAFGTLVPATLLGWGIIWGWASQEAGRSRLAFLRDTHLRSWACCIPLALLLAGGRQLHLLSIAAGWLQFAAFALFAGFVALASVVGLGMRPEERAWAAQRLPGPVRRLLRT